MKKILKQTLAMLLAVIMVGGAAPIVAFFAVAEDGYKSGDIIEFGSYPQSDVTDTLGSILDAIDGEWTSYNYDPFTGCWSESYVENTPLMRYRDVLYNGNNYRGVTVDQYRNYSNNCQKDNGYNSGKIYWFKFEPIKWKILDPSTGFVMCNSIIDSQAYGSETYNKEGLDNYFDSSIRKWLINVFYDTAFSNEQKYNIKDTALNDNFADNIFLLSFDEVQTSAYGFAPNYLESKGRQLQGSDYAKCQGLHVYPNYDSSSCWRLRSPGIDRIHSCGVNEKGWVYDTGDVVYATNVGIVPALKLQSFDFNVALSSIVIKTMPTKTTYSIGESFNQSGLTLTVKYSDGSTKTISSGFTCSGFSSTTTGDKTITVTYDGKTTTFNVRIVEPVGKVKSVSLSDLMINYKKSGKLIPKITANEGAKYTVTYASSDPKVVSVDNSGNVKGLKTGTATVTVTVKDEQGTTVKDTCNVKVKLAFWQVLIKIFLFGWIWY